MASVEASTDDPSGPAGRGAGTTGQSPARDTLPITTRDGPCLAPDLARAFGERHADDYAAGRPFEHIVIDEFLPPAVARALIEDFPKEPTSSETRYELGYGGHRKREIKPHDCGRYSRDVFALFNSAAMLGFLEALTGIEGLISDPYYAGGGYHETGAGGFLGIHADFRVNQPLRLERRLNLLIYLNPDWDEAWGGALELWDREMRNPVQSIPPLFNRCVIFNTDPTAFHGHPEPMACPPSVRRRSIALYYYTASHRIFEDVSSLGTLYRSRPGETQAVRASVRRLQFENYLVRDWLPPAIFRGLSRLRRAAKAKG